MHTSTQATTMIWSTTFVSVETFWALQIPFQLKVGMRDFFCFLLDVLFFV